MNYENKYLKYKNKYLKLKYFLDRTEIKYGGTKIYNNSPLETINLTLFEHPLDNSSYKIHTTEEIPSSLDQKCVVDEIPTKNDYNYRITLFNVHNFVSICNTNNEFKEIGRNLDKFTKFLNDTNSDLLFLTNIVPDYSDLYDEHNNRILDYDTKLLKSNFDKLISSLNFEHLYIENNKSISNYYSANSIFSKYEIIETKNYNIDIGEELISCVIKIHDHIDPIVFLLTRFNNNNENSIIKILEITKELKKSYKYIVLSGDMNLSIQEYHKNKLKDVCKQLIYINPNYIMNKYTNFSKEKTTDLFFVSEDFLFDFEISVKIVKSNLSNHYPVIFDFKNIDNEFKLLESELCFIFNTLVLELIYKKNEYETEDIFYKNIHVTGSLFIDDNKYKFSKYSYKLIKETQNGEDYIIFNNRINKKLEKKNFLVLLNDFYKQIFLTKRNLLPILNFYKKITNIKNDVNLANNLFNKCFESLCEEIKKTENYNISELKILEDYFNDIDKDETNIEQFFNKYYEVIQSNETIIIKLFGFIVTVIELVDGVEKWDYYDFGYNYSEKLNNFIDIYLNKRLYTSTNLNYKELLANKFNLTIYDDFLFAENLRTNIDKVDYNNNKFFILHLSEVNEQYRKLLYDYTAEFSNLTDVLLNNKDLNTKWIFTEEKKDILYQGKPYLISEVVNILDTIFASAPKIKKEFSVFRASTFINLYSIGIDILNKNFQDIHINYYQSTTLDINGFGGAYTNILYPVILEILIPEKSQILILGGGTGQPGQKEVLLNNKCILKYTGNYYYKKFIANLDKNYNYAYALVIKYRYIKI